MSAEEDSDEEIIITKKKRKSVVAVESDSEEENDSIYSKTPQQENVVENLECSQNEVSSCFKENSCDEENTSKVHECNGEENQVNEQYNGDSSDSDNKLDLGSSVKKNLKNGTLDKIFDAETSSDEEKNDISQKDSSNEDTKNNSSDEEEPAISEELQKKLLKLSAKGAAKKSKAPSVRKSSLKAQKLMEEELTNIHSESQRMMREREVKMPYHNPKKVGLSVFLARTQQKQEALKSVTPRSWKNLPDVTHLIKGDNLQEMSKCGAYDNDLKKNLSRKIDSTTNLDDEHNNVQINSEVQSVRKQLDLDDLPDLIIEKDSKSTSQEMFANTSTKNTLQTSQLIKLPSLTSSDLVTFNSDVEKDIDKLCVSSFIVVNNSESQQNCDMENNPENSSESLHTEITVNIADDSSKVNRENISSNLTDNVVSKLTSNEKTNDCCQEEDVQKSSSISKSYSVQKRSNDFKNLSDSEVENESTKNNNEIEVQSSKFSDLKDPSNIKKSQNLQRKSLVGLNNLPSSPRLSNGDHKNVIDFSDDEDNGSAVISKPVTEGVQKLMSRLMKHSIKRVKKAQDVEISTVIRNKQNHDEKENLKVEKIIYHIEGEEVIDPKLNKPGAKLVLLKETLQEKMAADREKSRKMKAQLMEMDNEEGFEEEEEEDEFTDEESESEQEADDEEDDDMDIDQYTAEEKAKKEDNPFVDDEAEIDSVDDEAEIDSVDDEDDLHLQFDDQESKDEEEARNEAEKKRKAFLDNAFTKTKSIDLFDDEANVDLPQISQSQADTLDISERPFKTLSQEKQLDISKEDSVQNIDNPDRDDGPSNASFQSLYKESSFNNSMDSSFEFMGSLIPAGQRPSKKNRSSDSSLTISSSKQTSLKMPIENSQDLFNLSTNSPIQYSKQLSDDSHLTLNESHSNLLDDDGMELSQRKSRRKLLMTDSLCTQSAESDMLALCSGQFTEIKSTQKDIVFDQEASGFSGSQELLALCSGRFNKFEDDDTHLSNTSSPKAASSSGTQPFEVDALVNCPTNTQENENDLLQLCSGVFTERKTDEAESTRSLQEEPCSPEEAIIKKKKAKPIVEDDDFEIGNGNFMSSDEEVPDNDEDKEKNFKGLFTKHKKLRKEFVEDEAELSGSEVDSDEDDDLREEDDILEEEEGDHDVLLSEEELRNQVGRVHLKSVIDSDKKQIRLMQEMLLQDGDLYSESGGRTRRFRWRNVDEDTQADMFHGSDEGSDEEETEQEKWRVERLEREKFLNEQKENHDEEKPESQTIKLGKVSLKSKKVICKSKMKDDSYSKSDDIPHIQNDKNKTPLTPPGLFKKPGLKVTKSGSFLNRNNKALKKIAEMNKGEVVGNLCGPAKTSKGFVFNLQKNAEGEPKPQVKRSHSIPNQQPAAKKMKLERANSIPTNSIFNLIN